MMFPSRGLTQSAGVADFVATFLVVGGAEGIVIFLGGAPGDKNPVRLALTGLGILRLGWTAPGEVIPASPICIPAEFWVLGVFTMAGGGIMIWSSRLFGGKLLSKSDSPGLLLGKF